VSSEPTHKITVKVGDALRTVQADTHEEFVEELEKAHDSLQACYDLLVAARAVGNVAQVSATVTPVAQHATPDAPPASFTSAAMKQCQHGDMTPRTGNGAKGPWRGWFCPTPKGTVDQCKAIFINRGTPEWNAFPA
jgi:hypothetical protein